MLRKFAQTALATGCALTLGLGAAPAVTATPVSTPSLVQTAAADEVSDLEQKVKESADAYNSAVSRQEELQGQIDDLNSKIADLEDKLPAQKERSNTSYKALYKYQSDTASVVMMLLNSSSITDMLSMVDSYNWVIEYNTGEIKKTITMENDLENSKSQVEADKADADAAANDAYNSLQQAQQARQEAAERAAAAQAAEQAAKEAEIAASTTMTSEEKSTATEQVAQTSSTTSSSNVGWTDNKTAFINKWAPRIDAYLSGSPTAGTGKYYAEAAWNNGVDPRWAPAISMIESTKGAACFRSHNAWGFGSSGYSSWQEGINAVVSTLGSSMYGGYLTRDAAAKYCPPTADEWYNNVSAQMAMI